MQTGHTLADRRPLDAQSFWQCRTTYDLRSMLKCGSRLGCGTVSSSSSGTAAAAPLGTVFLVCSYFLQRF